MMASFKTTSSASGFHNNGKYKSKCCSYHHDRGHDTTNSKNIEEILSTNQERSSYEAYTKGQIRKHVVDASTE